MSLSVSFPLITGTPFDTDARTTVCFWRGSSQWDMASSFMTFLDHTQRRTTVSRTPLDEWSALRRDLYLTTHNTHNRQTSMPPVGFEPTISAGERPQTYALDGATTGTGMNDGVKIKLSEATHQQASRSTKYSHLFSRWVVTMSVRSSPLIGPHSFPLTMNE